MVHTRGGHVGICKSDQVLGPFPVHIGACQLTALDDARAFREKHPAGSTGAMAAFDSLSQISKFAVRILASITAGAVPRGCVVASSLRRPAVVQWLCFER